MTNNEHIAQRLRALAQDARLQALRQKLASSETLPDDVLARYHAGLLTPEEEALIEHEIALSPHNLRALAEIAEDIEESAKTAWWRRLLERSKELLEIPRITTWAYAGSAAAVMLLAFRAGPALIARFDRPPGEIGEPHYSTIVEAPKGPVDRGSSAPSYLLPWGVDLARVDPAWSLNGPLGRVSSLKWFTWHPLEGAVTYTLRLYDATGRQLHEGSGLEHPYSKLPSRVRRGLDAGHYVWMVEAAMRGTTEPIRNVGSFDYAPPD